MKQGKFPNKVLQHMKAKGLTQADLTRAVGGNKQTIWKLVHGLTRLSDEWSKELEPILGIPWHVLVDEAEREIHIAKPTGLPISPNGYAFVEDPNELSLLGFWRVMSDGEKESLLSFFRQFSDRAMRKAV